MQATDNPVTGTICPDRRIDGGGTHLRLSGDRLSAEKMEQTSVILPDQIMGILLAMGIGCGCRCFGIPLPAPQSLNGSLLVLTMTCGFVAADLWLRQF